MGNEQETEKRIIEEAKEKANQIIKEAQLSAKQIHGASLEYVDDMLTEVSLAAKRAKESVRIIMEQALEDLELKIDIIEENQKEILKDLQELSENGKNPIRKANYAIKVDEAYIPKQSYSIKIKDGAEEKVEVHRPAKVPFEIKVADEWKDRVETMLEEQNLLLSEAVEDMTKDLQQEEDGETDEIEEIEGIEEIEEKGNSEDIEGFKPEDFDLDEEYFMWLSETEK